MALIIMGHNDAYLHQLFQHRLFWYRYRLFNQFIMALYIMGHNDAYDAYLHQLFEHRLFWYRSIHHGP